MAAEKHQLTVALSKEDIWPFIQNMDHWATLIPDYLAHEMVSDNEVIWVFKVDLGFMKKPVKLNITIVDREEPTKISFNLEGLSDQFKGGGHFSLESINEETSTLEGFLDISAVGMMAAMVNPVLKTFVPKTVQDLTTNIVNELTKVTK